MSEISFPVMLDQVFFTRTVVIAVQGYQPPTEPVQSEHQNSIDVSPIENEPGRYVAIMRTLYNKEANSALPYMIDMECVGHFRADPTMPQEEASRAVTIVAHNVIYGAIREAVAWITGRQPFGPLMLGLSILKSAPKAETE